MAARVACLPAHRLAASVQDGGAGTSRNGRPRWPEPAFAARSQDGGVREAAGGRRPGPGPGGGRWAGGAGWRGGRRAGERGGVPAAGRRHRHCAGGAAEGAGGAARGARLLPGRLLRAAGAGQPRRGGRDRRGAPGAAAAPGPGAVVRAPGSPLPQDGLRQQRRRGLRGAGRRRPAAEGGRGRAAVQRAAAAHLPARGSAGGGGGGAAGAGALPRPRGRAFRRLPLRRPHLLRAAGVRRQGGRAVRRPGRRLRRRRREGLPGRAACAGGRAGRRPLLSPQPLPGGGLQAGAGRPGPGHGPGAAGEEARHLHEPGGVPEESHRLVRCKSEARRVTPGREQR